MLVSDDYRFAFIDIPRTAGMAIRAALAPYDSQPGRFQGIQQHSLLGQLDMSHLPLSALRKYFAADYEKISRYVTFAVVRDPLERFPSSLKQRLTAVGGLYSPSSLSAMSRDDILREAYTVIEQLAARPLETDPALIHFLPQVAFVFDRGHRFVRHVVPFEDLVTGVPALLRRHLGVEVSLASANVSIRHSSRVVARAVRAVRQSAAPFLSAAMLRSAARALQPFRASGNPFRDVLAARDDINRFIREYYAADFALHAEAGRAEAA